MGGKDRKFLFGDREELRDVTSDEILTTALKWGVDKAFEVEKSSEDTDDKLY